MPNRIKDVYALFAALALLVALALSPEARALPQSFVAAEPAQSAPLDAPPGAPAERRGRSC